ncbi:MAG TPA: hypothetical protein VII06_07305 [Chloroflexota bacterium]
MDPTPISRPAPALSAPPAGAVPAPAESRVAAPAGAALTTRRPSLARRAAAVVVGILILAVVAASVEFNRALLVWLLFAVFLFLWPSWPQRTAGEQRAEAWPFLPSDR